MLNLEELTNHLIIFKEACINVLFEQHQGEHSLTCIFLFHSDTSLGSSPRVASENWEVSVVWLVLRYFK